MRKIFLMGLILSFLFSGTAFALQYATHVKWDKTNIPGSARSDIQHALGMEDGKFLSLRRGGIAAFDFGTGFNTSASIFETTWGNREGYKEFADVYVGNTFSLNINDYVFVGTIQNDMAEKNIDLTGISPNPFRYLLIQDATQREGGVLADGFDIDAVGVLPVPEPATIALLGIGLLGLAGVSRRKK